MSSCGFGATVIATCLVSSSSFVLMPSTSSSRVSINPKLYGRGRHLCNGNPTLTCNNKLTLTKLTAVRSSGRSDTSTKNNERNISQMTLPQILQLLNRLNIRFPPDATRSELEDLLYQYYKSSNQPVTSSKSSSSKSPPSSTSSVQSNNGQNIVDAVVLDDDKSVNDEEYYQRDQTNRSTAHHRRSQQSHNRQRRQGRTTSRPNNRTSYGNSTHRAESNQYRPRSRRENYDLYDNYNPTTTSNRVRRKDVIDLDTFDLPDDPNNRNEYYDNGAQIFLMGFLEAGKTATQLTLDSVAEAVNPFSGEKRWYDEERGREVLDVNILDYSPDYGRRSQRRHSSETGRRRRRRRRAGRPGRNYRVMANDVSSQRRRSVERQPPSNVTERPKRDSLEQPASFAVATDRSGSSAIDGNSAINSTAKITGTDQRVQARNERSRQDDTKPIYGLYNGDIGDRPSPNNPNNVTGKRHESQPRHKKPMHPEKTWKKRLRKKFDAALGLQSPYSPSSSEALYDSWKTQVGAVNDGRKEALRNDINNKNSSTRPPSPNNRRSRMRAKLNSGQISKTAKSYLDEPPFWRKDGGTIASALFDSEHPTSRPRREVDPRLKRRYNNSLDTLEALLRSPLGRQNTVTSLVLFIARSSLSWFGSLCRWAGVRGTIPQPIVVTTVFAMGISSRRGYRTLSLCLSLLALRMAGEFLHGSLHGNEFWEDDYNKDTHEWTQE